MAEVMSFTPVPGGKYNVRLLSGLKECLCVSVNDIMCLATMDIGGNVISVHYSDVFPIPFKWSSDGDSEESEVHDPDICPSCGRQGTFYNLSCVCHYCNKVLWGC